DGDEEHGARGGRHASRPGASVIGRGDGRPIALVPTRYGNDVVGGSEAVMREAALGLSERGWPVEVLTTCARDHYTWRNVYPAGSHQIDGITVRRFPTVQDVARREHESLSLRVQAGERLPFDEQLAWINSGFRVPGLYQHLLGERQRYRAVIFSPYLFWTTVTCAAIDPERTIVMPCLHDEVYAYLDLVQEALGSAAALWFLSEPEHALAHRIATVPDDHVVTGAGVHVPDAYDPAGFRERFGVAGRFIVYAGRRESGKGWDHLLHAFAEAVRRYDLPLDLVTIGAGTVSVPPSIKGRVHDLGFLDDRDRDNALAAAEVYVQPSANESFSRTIMESWLAGTPVIGSAASEVVAWHCERSEGGLVYRDTFELAQALMLLAERPEVAERLARSGRAYVLREYQWPAVLDRMEASLERFG
ncbi:MAG TPA: glycosyltransferase family 4 protein, partial [Acidimicrobiales bacterium]|nr:glycosyltransferase family 4 protein [Acidimicrobiales bacterium]